MRPNILREPKEVVIRTETRNLNNYRKKHELTWADKVFLERGINMKLPAKLKGTKDEKHYR